MMRYIFKIAVFVLPLVFIFYIKPVSLLIDKKYQDIVAGKEIYYSLKKSKQKGNIKKLLIGDSAGFYLFPNTDTTNTFNSLASNQAIGMVGQYILIQNYLNEGNEIDTLYMCFGPFGLQNNLNQVYTFHYFLKPFYKDEYKKYFTSYVFNQIKKIPYYWLCREPYILTSNWAPKFKSKDPEVYTFLSPITVEYFRKIIELSIEDDFVIIVFPAPVSIKWKQKIETFDKNEILNNGLSSEFSSYFENIEYLPDSCFFDDGIHLLHPEKYATRYREKWFH